MLVEDDVTIARVLERQLLRWGYELHVVTAFDKVMEQFHACLPHLVLMDISLPFYDGYHWCGEIRKISRVPLLFISSAGESINQVMAMNMGGDGFICKPFDIGVVTAKIQALLRRAYDFGSNPEVLEHRGAVLNLGDMTVLYGGQRLELSKNEFKILLVLLENKGSAVPRDEMMRRLWETESFIDDNTLTVNVNRLRKRLDSAGLCDFIKTKKGVGYLVEK